MELFEVRVTRIKTKILCRLSVGRVPETGTIRDLTRTHLELYLENEEFIGRRISRKTRKNRFDWGGRTGVGETEG